MGDGAAIALSVVASASTFIGGLLALRATATLRYFFAFSAGTLLAMALADLLPEGHGPVIHDARQASFSSISSSGMF